MSKKNDRLPSLVNGKPVRKPRLIEAVPVRDYAYQWIAAGCPLHQWCSGAAPVTTKTINRVMVLLKDQWREGAPLSEEEFANFWGLTQLLEFLCHHLGEPASKYDPDDEDGPTISVINTSQGDSK